MEKIKFNKIINYKVLIEAINLRSSLSSYLEKIDYSFPSGFSKDEVLEENLVFHFNVALSSDQKNELAELVNSIDDNYDLVIRDKIQQTSVKDKRAFGKEFIDIFSANNKFKNKSNEQIGLLLSKYPSLIICCLTGSIEALYYTVCSIEPDEAISSDEISEFKKRIEIFLGDIV